MGHDAMASDASSPAYAAVARDPKKKRGNRSAKLKQSKLDVRREQWLSQVKDAKEVKAVSSPAAAGANSGSPILASPHPPLPRRRAETQTRTEEPEQNKEEADVANQEAGSSDADSPMHSPVFYNSTGRCMQQKHCSGSGGIHSLSSGSSAWSSSRSVSDAEDEGTGGGTKEKEEEEDVLDDWEAVADALSFDNNNNHQDLGPEAPPAAPVVSPEPARASTRPESIKSQTRAWSPDDVFRPHTLPSLSKQVSFPSSMGNCWVGMGIGAAQKSIISFQMSCPICYEDLDPTDSSFLPCPCGFHLCLFCHKRILEADARCPGCRNQYKSTPLGGEAGREIENLVQMRLSRSCSMGPRY
ncbi:cellulose synthase-like protein D2 [Brachypodium distachyon]|uniref:RING-type domain-containing protein n=1 Tax=Brachypodium distachyon TaxID=15368 RepID=I1IAX9_BRADI|nr:cellulose synthase-like protein D2 [Brachypodium distachyon]KQK00050.1 hypothetical protein BRADI_3g47000v3 [Brachypodium distachyon]KQK00051.1 hypothetical protein BRADI_3g47000v3 [Brachypodium distachyon]KQK00052.1 hypothetical protein BRADI_3g47000v3 [Brachypodium distachyon]PNT68919.1 hypothetical protein BRADI_3g47000v3 [Brachypodium distachyon]|eukprot:XP_003575233.1 cellulose synthase-like protein D2 [Brachypodium distachyon]